MRSLSGALIAGLSSLQKRLAGRLGRAPATRGWRWWSGGRRAAARGVALGLFCGFLVPFGQIPASLLIAPLIRANVVAAAAATFVTNPLTMPAVYAAGYWVGARLVDAHRAWVQWSSSESMTGLPEGGASIGIVATTLLGVTIIATACAVAGYALVWSLWPRITLSRRRRAGSNVPTEAVEIRPGDST